MKPHRFSTVPLYFPYWADGGGYTTQFVLFSGRTEAIVLRHTATIFEVGNLLGSDAALTFKKPIEVRSRGSHTGGFDFPTTVYYPKYLVYKFCLTKRLRSNGTYTRNCRPRRSSRSSRILVRRSCERTDMSFSFGMWRGTISGVS